jgi:hypothetical protein
MRIYSLSDPPGSCAPWVAPEAISKTAKPAPRFDAYSRLRRGPWV